MATHGALSFDNREMISPPDTPPVSQTAYYCCGIRMEDAATRSPICGDDYARYFFNEEGRQVFAKFKSFLFREAKVINVTRHRIIDDLLKEELSRHPDTMIVLIGAGFDTRAFRLRGGKWYELDEPNLIAYKNYKLPADICKNKLIRIPYDYTKESLVEKLSFIGKDSRVIVIIEGVMSYLNESTIKQLIADLQQSFENHLLICDLGGHTFSRIFGWHMHLTLRKMGSPMNHYTETPERVFLANHYTLIEKKSIVLRTAELGCLIYPTIIVRNFLKLFSNNYSIFVFQHHSAGK